LTCDSKAEFGICRMKKQEQGRTAQWDTPILNMVTTALGAQGDRKDGDVTPNLHFISTKADLAHHGNVKNSLWPKDKHLVFYSPLITSTFEWDRADKRFYVSEVEDVRTAWAEEHAAHEHLPDEVDFERKRTLADSSCNDATSEDTRRQRCCGANNECIALDGHEKVSWWKATYDEMTKAWDKTATENHAAARAAAPRAEVCCETVKTYTDGTPPTTTTVNAASCNYSKTPIKKYDDVAASGIGIKDLLGQDAFWRTVGKTTVKALCDGKCPCKSDAAEHVQDCPALKSANAECEIGEGANRRCVGPKYYVKFSGNKYYRCSASGAKGEDLVIYNPYRESSYACLEEPDGGDFIECRPVVY